MSSPRDSHESEMRRKETLAMSDDASDNHDDAPAEMNMTRTRSSVEIYPEGPKLALLLLSIYLSVFLVALDRTIIATALPVITDEFHSFADVGWYNAGFLLPTTAFQLFFGRLYTFYSPKWIFMSLVFVFEAGSALCGAAPNSVAFIWGRAIAGLGAGGLMNGAMILIMHAAPLPKRPMYMGLFGACFGVASVAGPLLGGVFTSKVTWRWCFYINLPIGGIVLVFLYFFLEDIQAVLSELPVREKIKRVDIPGTIILVPCITCLLLVLQWGGSQYAWSDGRIIALFVVFGVLLIVFIAIQIYQQESATVPPRIIKQRTIAAGIFYTFCLGSSFMTMVYYLSIWFQAIKGDSAIKSGLSTLPFILTMVIASIFSGILVSRIGYYNPSIIGGAALASIGAGLITCFSVTTAHPFWIGAQVLYGFGIGLGLMQTNIAAQTVLEKKDAPTGMSVVFLGQGLGGAISVAIAQNVLNNKLVQGIHSLGVNIDPKVVVNTGATDLRRLFSADQLPALLKVYNSAIGQVFIMGLVFACVCLIGGFAMEWKSTNKGKGKGKGKGKPSSSSKPKEVVTTDGETKKEEVVATEKEKEEV